MVCFETVEGLVNGGDEEGERRMENMYKCLVLIVPLPPPLVDCNGSF
jgi:hypothetical protein